MKRIFNLSIFIFFVSFFLPGCAQNGVITKGFHATTNTEAEWIRNGQPIQFEGELWFPADGIENLLDSEMDLVDAYNDVEVFVEKKDVRPYSRLYTKFAKNKFRFFEKRANE